MPDALSGPELDAEIARRVFGREVLGLAWGHYCEYDYLEWRETEPEDTSYRCDLRPVVLRPRGGCMCHYPDIMELPRCLGHRQACLSAVRPYSTDIAAAWEVVEAMKQRGYVYDLWGPCDGEYYAGFRKQGDAAIYEVWAASQEEAICRAALAALEGSE